MNRRNLALPLLLLSAGCADGGPVAPADVSRPSFSLTSACDQTFVPGDDVRAAIAAADPGQTICLEPGTYTASSSIGIFKNGITLRGLGGSSAVTIQQSTSEARGLQTSNTSGVTLQGFTFEFTGTIPPPGTPGPRPRWGIKPELNVIGFSMHDVVVTNFPSTGLDLNGVHGAILTNVRSFGNGGAGIAVRHSSNITIDGAETSGNSWGGLALWSRGSDEVLSDVTVTNSTFSNEPSAGVFVQHAGSFQNIVITGNTISGNGAGVTIGVGGDPGTPAGGFRVTQNDIAGNTDAGLINNGVGTVDARENWWGHASGPGGPDGKAGGQGDAIHGKVTWDPRLTQPISKTSTESTILASTSSGGRGR